MTAVMKSIISDLHLKYAEKTWNETFQLVRRCMTLRKPGLYVQDPVKDDPVKDDSISAQRQLESVDKSRDKSQPCEPLVRSLERLQEVLNVTSMRAMKSRLETMAKKRGMGFHITEATCYLTADLFYLEVVLLPCGGVEEVKVAPHGGSPASSESLLQSLRSKNFAEFSMKLEGVFTQYNFPGDNEMKLKLFASLQYLGKDLQEMSRLPSDSKGDVINNGRIGSLTAGREDHPLTIQFYKLPTEGRKTSDNYMEPVVQAAQVAVGPSDLLHQLQVAPVVPVPAQPDSLGSAVFPPLGEVSLEMLPACFLLRLQPAVPMMKSFVNKIGQITDVPVPDVDLQWAAFPKLLMRGSLSANSHRETSDTIFTVPLPGDVKHSYVFPGVSWEGPSQRGTVMTSIPFTHPTHVPDLVELLRHQCAFNALLGSCVCAGPGSTCDQHFEILLESDSSFSVTFRRPATDRLAVLLVNISAAHQMTCSLFGAGRKDSSLEEYLSSFMKRCMSVPLTLQALHSKLQQMTSPPLSPVHLAPAEPENDPSTPPSSAVADSNDAPTTPSQSAAVPEGIPAVCGSPSSAVSAANSEVLPEINATPAVDP